MTKIDQKGRKSSAHKRTRQRLLYNMPEGEPCYWCGLPKSHDPAKNWDGEPLHADHTTAVAHGGGHADRLLCATCNRQRGNGDWDDQRPAALGIHPRDWTKTGRKLLPPVTEPKPAFTWG